MMGKLLEINEPVVARLFDVFQDTGLEVGRNLMAVEDLPVRWNVNICVVGGRYGMAFEA